MGLEFRLDVSCSWTWAELRLELKLGLWKSGAEKVCSWSLGWEGLKRVGVEIRESWVWGCTRVVKTSG